MDEQNGYLPLPKGFSTTCIHYGQEPEQWESAAVVPPMVTSSMFLRSNDESVQEKFFYGRLNNPSRSVLEKILAQLDNAKYALTYSAGMGAVTAVLSLLKTGDHMVCAADIYDGSTTMIRNEMERVGIDVTFIDFSAASNFEKSIKPNTKMAYTETPSNPTLKVTDLAAVAKIAKKHNIILVTDNTFLTPYLQRPLDLGVDIALYSLTKYISGHGDVIMGALTFSDDGLFKKLSFIQKNGGIIPSPFDCYQVTRSLTTLPLRMQQHSKSALIVAKYLSNHPRVKKVLHPGLPTHPGHETFKKQTSGHSGLFSFRLDGTVEDGKKLINTLKLFYFAGSLGAPQSLAHIPALLWSNRVPVDGEGTLIRLSIGLEDPEDLIADFEQGFLAISK